LPSCSIARCLAHPALCTDRDGRPRQLYDAIVAQVKALIERYLQLLQGAVDQPDLTDLQVRSSLAYFPMDTMGQCG